MNKRLDYRKVIEGKLYDTKETEHVYDVSKPGYDSNWEQTDMYRTKNGRFFVAGEGGALTRWRQFNGDGWVPGEGIQTISSEEALKLLEQADAPAGVMEEYFEIPSA